MGLLDRYRSFGGLSDAEVRADLHAAAARRRAAELARVDDVDCSRTTWHERPPADVVAAITFTARRALHRYAERSEEELRSALGEQLGRPTDLITLGDGAASLLERAIGLLCGPDAALVTPWPSYPLGPLAARDAGARVIPVQSGLDPGALGRACAQDGVGVLLVTNPNDPTGELLRRDGLAELLASVPDRVTVLLDEALRDFVDAEPVDATLALLDEHPNLVVVRTFSKAWGLAGLRLGHATAHRRQRELLDRLAPRLGPGDLAVAGTLEALRSAGPTVRARASRTVRERTWLADRLTEFGLEVAPSQTSTLWVRDPRGGLAERLEQRGIRVLAGETLGAPQHARITVREHATSERLVRALLRDEQDAAAATS